MDSLISKVGNVTDGLKRMSKLVISSVSGAAAGAGVSLAFSGDFVVCADNAKFIMAFVNLGLVPDTGGTYLFVKSLWNSENNGTVCYRKTNESTGSKRCRNGI